MWLLLVVLFVVVGVVVVGSGGVRCVDGVGVVEDLRGITEMIQNDP